MDWSRLSVEARVARVKPPRRLLRFELGHVEQITERVEPMPARDTGEISRQFRHISRTPPACGQVRRPLARRSSGPPAAA